MVVPCLPQYVLLLQSALQTPYGICVRTPSLEALRDHINAAKQADPKFKALALHRSKTDYTELWLVKEDPDTPRLGPGQLKDLT